MNSERPQPPDRVESPFLNEEPFAEESEAGWEVHLGALEAETPFLSAFEQTPALPGADTQGPEIEGFDDASEVDRLTPGGAGQYDAALRALQQKLNRVRAAIDESPIPEDGMPGDKTTAAIRDFQVLAGLPADGKANDATRARLDQFIRQPELIISGHHRSLKPLSSSQTCLNGLKTKRVAVVGAGLAGLAAALRLAQHGVKVTVYEARPEVGGRVRSNYGKLSRGRVIEEGAELIGSFHTTWLSLARDFQLSLITRTPEDHYPRQGLDVKLHLDKGLNWDDIRQVRCQVDEVLAAIAREAEQIQNIECPWQDPLPGPQKWDQMSVADALDLQHVPRGSRLWKALEVQLVNDEVAPLEQMNYLGLLCKVKGGQGPRLIPDDPKDPCKPVGPGNPRALNRMGYWEELEVFRCAEGCQTLAKKMAKQIEAVTGTKIAMHRAVTAIQIHDRGVTLISHNVRADGKVDEAHPLPDMLCDYVILAIPPSAWGKVKITRDKRPIDLDAKVGRLTMRPAVKFFTATDDRFWLKDRAAPSGASLTLGQIWEGTDNQMQTGDQGFVLNVFAGPTRPTPDKSGRPPTQPEMEGELERTYAHYPARKGRKVSYVDWGKEAFINSGYWSPKPGEIFRVGSELTKRIEDRIFLAGEHTHIAFFGYMEGALRSGLRAADHAMMSACGEKPRPCGPVVTTIVRTTPQRGAATAETWDAESVPGVIVPWTSEEDGFEHHSEEQWDEPESEHQGEDENAWDDAPAEVDREDEEPEAPAVDEALEPAWESDGAWNDEPEVVAEFPPTFDEAEHIAAPAHMAFSHILLESLDPATSAMVPGVVPATPATLTTSFYDANATGTKPDPALQQSLTNLIDGKRAYKSVGKNLAVALVDLSGANKASPKYAGFNDLANFYGGSVNKITGLLGVYQLLAEANEALQAKPSIGDAAGLESELKSIWTQAGIPEQHHPRVAMILSVQPGSPPKAKIRPELMNRLNYISKGNQNGSTPIVLLKFPYIGSTLLAHGLFSPTNGGGLWTRMAYGKIAYLGHELSLSAWPSKENPHPKTAVHNINAVSVAQWYTLAAQRRMIDAATSRAILRHLQTGGCTTIDVSSLDGSGEVSSKCGIFQGWVHNTLYFKETATLREFVVVILTKNYTFGVMKDLFTDLVALVP